MTRGQAQEQPPEQERAPRSAAEAWMHRDTAPGERPVVLLLGFGGWEDAGGTVTSALALLAGLPGTRKVEATWAGAENQADDLHDLRVHRPTAVTGPDGVRRVRWPRLRLMRVDGVGETELLIASGPEPSHHWAGLAAELLAIAASEGATCAIKLAATSQEVPHTRPLPVWCSSEDPTVRGHLDADEPRRLGALGFSDVVAHTADAAGWPTLQLEVGVPSYVAGAPQPLATLRLLDAVATFADLTLDVRDLEEDAAAWRLGADRLAAADARIGALVESLEARTDAAALPEARAESIAREFERYLQRRPPVD
ncbi:PAC2 family protein [Galactobacter caseinivorans]|nr:PAC2 family protein [Galactobacter caseinivorans]